MYEFVFQLATKYKLYFSDYSSIFRLWTPPDELQVIASPRARLNIQLIMSEIGSSSSPLHIGSLIASILHIPGYPCICGFLVFRISLYSCVSLGVSAFQTLLPAAGRTSV